MSVMLVYCITGRVWKCLCLRQRRIEGLVLTTWAPEVSSCPGLLRCLKLLLGLNLLLCFLSFCKLCFFCSLLTILVSGVKHLMQLNHFKLMPVQPVSLGSAVLSHSKPGCSWQWQCRGHFNARDVENVLCGKQKCEFEIPGTNISGVLIAVAFVIWGSIMWTLETQQYPSATRAAHARMLKWDPESEWSPCEIQPDVV